MLAALALMAAIVADRTVRLSSPVQRGQDQPGADGDERRREFAYLAPGQDDEEDGPIAWFEASEAIVDKDRDSVVVAGSEVLEVFDGPITLEDPPEHEDQE